MIKRKREELRITQETLAEMADVSVRTLQRAEKGENINIESLKSIAAVLDIPWDLLIEKDLQLSLIQEEFSKQAGKLEKSNFFRNKEIVDTMLSMGEDTKEGPVMDLACGPGILTKGLSENNWKVTAVDITKEMLDIVREKKLSNIKVVRGDANKLPFEDNFFKGVFTRLSLHHFKYPEKTIAEMKRVLSEDGTIIIGDILSKGSKDERILHNAIEKLRDNSHTNCLSKEEIIETARSLDLKLLEYKELQYERELKEWTNISGENIYEALYTILKNIAEHHGLPSLNLNIRENKLYFTHTWGFFKFKKASNTLNLKKPSLL